MRRPVVSIMAIVAVTLLAMSSMFVNGVDQVFTVEQFHPDSEAVEGRALLYDEFDSLSTVGLLTEFSWQPTDFDEGLIEGNLRKDQFLKVLEFERSLVEDARIGSVLARPVEPGSTIVSPVNLISIALYNIQILGDPDRWSDLDLDLAPLLDPETGDPVLDEGGNVTMYPPVTYDNLIRFMGSEYSQTFYLHIAINQILTDEDMPESERDSLRRLFSNDLEYQSTPVNASAGLSFIRVDRSLFNESFGAYEVEVLLSAMADEADDDTVQFTVIGNHLINRDITSAATDDLTRLFPLVALVIVLLLWLFLRDIAFVIVSLSGLIAAITWVYGLGAAMGITFSPLSLAVPFMVLGVGMDFSIHMLLGYKQQRQEGSEHYSSLEHVNRRVGGAIMLATVTTCIAYLSNSVSDMEGMMLFGVLNAVGISSAFIITMLLVPAFLTLRRGRGSAPSPNKVTVKVIDEAMRRMSVSVRRNGNGILAVIIVISMVLGVAATGIKMDFDPGDFVPVGSESEYVTTYVEENFQNTGLNSVEVLISGSMEDPALVSAFYDSLESMAQNKYVVKMGGAAQVDSVFSVMHDWANESYLGDPRYDSSFSSMYSLHFNIENGQYLGDADPEYLSSLREMALGIDVMREEFLQFHSPDAGLLRLSIEVLDVLSESAVREMRNILEDDIGPLTDGGYPITFTGGQLINIDVIDAMRDAQMMSVILTVTMAMLIVCLINLLRGGGLIMGALAVLPSALTIIWMWGALEILGITLNPLTMTVAALTVGLGVDYGIHMTHRFQVESEEHGIQKAMGITLEETGKGVIGGAVTTALGFGVIGMFSIRPISEFGLMTMASVAGAAAISLLLLPPLMAVWAKHRGLSD